MTKTELENHKKNLFLIELSDNEFKFVTINELREIDNSAAEFDGFTGVNVRCKIPKKALDDYIQSQPTNKKFGALNKQEKEIEGDSDLHKMRAEIVGTVADFSDKNGETATIKMLMDEVQELEKKRERLKKDYSAVCSAIKEMGDKSKERQNQITQLQKTLTEIKAILKTDEPEYLKTARIEAILMGKNS